jgi:hypothetical protein
VKYKLWNIVPFQGKGGESLLDSRALLRRSIGHSSLVDPRVWPLMNSRKLDSRYRTAWPIFTNRGPSPESRDLASQDKETLRILAASRGCSRGSIGLAFIEAFMNFSSSSYPLLDWRNLALHPAVKMAPSPFLRTSPNCFDEDWARNGVEKREPNQKLNGRVRRRVFANLNGGFAVSTPSSRYS